MQLARSLRPQAGLGGAARWHAPQPRGLSGAGLLHRRARLGLSLKEVRGLGTSPAPSAAAQTHLGARQGAGRQEP